MPRRERREREAFFKKAGLGDLPRGRPPKALAERVASGDSGPILAMWTIAIAVGETVGWKLARLAYLNRSIPELAEYFAHADMKADEATVVRRWAKRWNRMIKQEGVLDRLKADQRAI